MKWGQKAYACPVCHRRWTKKVHRDQHYFYSGHGTPSDKLPLFHKNNPLEKDMCGPRTYPTNQKYSAKAGSNSVKHQEPAGIKKISDVHYEFLGKDVRAGSKEFAIEGKQVLICAVGMRYFDAPADNDSVYIAFKFHKGSEVQLGKAWLITLKRFVREAKLWEEPVKQLFVSIAQLMEKNGPPCEAGCRALWGFLQGKPITHFGHTRDTMIIEITKYCMTFGNWTKEYSTQVMYDWYMKNLGEVPYDYLVFLARAMGVDFVGTAYPHAPGTKSYELVCRAVGIQP